MPKLLRRKVWLYIAIFFLGLVAFVYFSWLVEPYSPPKNLLLSNITDHQVTISWTTTIPTKGIILVSQDAKFRLLPILAKNLQKDDGERLTFRTGYYTTHHFTIGSLLPSKKYSFRIYQGQKRVFDGQFVTKPTLTTIISPNPVYGKVLRSDKKGVVGAIVYLRVGNEASQSGLLSTITNQNGGWSLDLANLGVSQKVKEQIIVEGGDLGRVKTATDSAHDKPWPDIILK